MLFIAGYHGSGKSTAAEHLSTNHNFIHVERSSVLTGIKNQENSEIPMRAWREERQKELGQFALEDMIAEVVRQQHSEAGDNEKRVVITGNRSLDEIRYTATSLEDIDGRPSKIIAIKVDAHLLFGRYIERARSDEDRRMSFDDFDSMLQRERNAGIERIFDQADHVVRNTGSKTELLRAFDKIVSE
jgi:adenylate kinase family enzyme